MSKRKTSGIDDLIATLIKQHGLYDAIDRALEKRWIETVTVTASHSGALSTYN
jgi:hypothetical protein